MHRAFYTYSCPFFRNEIGGEEERVVSLTRGQSPQNTQRRPLHRPPMAYGVSVLEFPPGETHWRHGTCPYQRHPRAIESVDQGARYYRKHFYGQGKSRFALFFLYRLPDRDIYS